jgi:hypothetical protein
MCVELIAKKRLIGVMLIEVARWYLRVVSDHVERTVLTEFTIAQINSATKVCEALIDYDMRVRSIAGQKREIRCGVDIRGLSVSKVLGAVGNEDTVLAVAYFIES